MHFALFPICSHPTAPALAAAIAIIVVASIVVLIATVLIRRRQQMRRHKMFISDMQAVESEKVCSAVSAAAHAQVVHATTFPLWTGPLDAIGINSKVCIPD